MLSCAKSERSKFQHLQNKCLNLVLNKGNLFNTKLLHKEAKMADLEHRARLASCRLMFKYKYCYEYTENTVLCTRYRDGPIFKQEQPSNVTYLKSCYYMCRKEWNSLPVQIRCIDDVKSCIKKHFWDIYLQSSTGMIDNFCGEHVWRFNINII